MRNIGIFLFLVIMACKNPARSKQSSTDLNKSKKIAEEVVEFNYAKEFKPKNPNQFIEDTLVMKTSVGNFEITPTGLLTLNNQDSIQLSTELIVEKAFFYKDSTYYYIFYTDTDYDGATSWIEKINSKSFMLEYTEQIQGFNLGRPLIKDGKAYVTAIGFIGKIDLSTGKYAWEHYNLYDREKLSFNSFDSIILKSDEVEFISENYSSKKIDRIIVDNSTGKIKLVDK